MNIDELKPGRELDALVAEAMETKPEPIDHDLHIDPIYSPRGFWVCLPEYEKGDVCIWEPIALSTKIAAAWLVVEQIQTMPVTVRWQFCDLLQQWTEGEEYIFALTPEMICKAALIAAPANLSAGGGDGIGQYGEHN